MALQQDEIRHLLERLNDELAHTGITGDWNDSHKRRCTHWKSW